jgi:acyl-coenzyme A synthetase/AMP-(fatty) acid ligase
MPEGFDFYTSGSTGAAKPIRRDLGEMKRDVAMLTRTFGAYFARKPVFVLTVQTSHFYGKIWGELLPAAVGCAVHPATVLSPEEFIAAQELYPSVFFVTTPSFLENLLAARGVAYKKNCVGVSSSGSLLSRAVSEASEAALGVSPIEVFGSTEAGGVGWRQQKNGPEWTVFDGVEASTEPDGRIRVESPFAMARPWVMDDAAEFTAPRRFLLKGRTDRRVKILESFVSLPDLEAALAGHPFVRKAHALASGADTPRVWALVELSAAGKAALKAGTYQGLIRTLCASLAPRFDKAALPRRVRFVNAFPYNAQGKLPRLATLPLLQSRLQEPVSENESCDGARLEADWTFIPDAVYFQGHFPGFAILPGVVQLYYVGLFIRRFFHSQPSAGSFRRLKFTKFILPRQTVRLSVTKRSADSFAFTITDASGACASSGLWEGGEA